MGGGGVLFTDRPARPLEVWWNVGVHLVPRTSSQGRRCEMSVKGGGALGCLLNEAGTQVVGALGDVVGALTTAPPRLIDL